MADCATIFALGALLSSVQIFNVMGLLQMDQFDCLNVFANFGRQALETNMSKPFQELIILVRDWSCDYEHEFGAEGGADYLQKYFSGSNKNHELAQHKQYIDSCYNEFKCVLMPRPGEKVLSQKHPDLFVKDLAANFCQHVKIFAETILKPENLHANIINGLPITLSQFTAFVRMYTDIFKSGDLVAPEAAFIVLSKKSHLIAVMDVIRQYHRNMETHKKMSMENLKKYHNTYLQLAIDDYRKSKRYGSDEYGEEYEKMLIEDIEYIYSLKVKIIEKKMEERKQRTTFWFRVAAVGGAVVTMLTGGAAGLAVGAAVFTEVAGAAVTTLVGGVVGGAAGAGIVTLINSKLRKMFQMFGENVEYYLGEERENAGYKPVKMSEIPENVKNKSKIKNIYQKIKRYGSQSMEYIAKNLKFVEERMMYFLGGER